MDIEHVIDTTEISPPYIFGLLAIWDAIDKTVRQKSWFYDKLIVESFCLIIGI